MTQLSKNYAEALRVFDASDFGLALSMMENFANQGLPQACFTLALWHHQGEGIPVDEKRCNYWLNRLEKLALEGSSEAQWELSQSYRFANLFPLDIGRANYWLELAANGGHGEARHHLAWYFEYGQYNYQIDIAASEAWYKKAFEQENPETLYKFAMQEFKDGEITQYGISLLETAAKKDFMQARHALNRYSK